MKTVPSASIEPVNLRVGAKKAEPPSGFILALFRMINGAPDEVISWTPDGDAFLIGADLNRLEGEVLPIYFRHNRFQSLVRQLNFYSFRKQNRERNVWIYKHDLFRRDHPEDLYLVRRRTCPGMDGRKQRFSRLSAKKLTRQDSVDSKSDADDQDDDSTGYSDDEAPVPTPAVKVTGKKRQIMAPRHKKATAKGFDSGWTASSTSVVDTSMLQDNPVSVSEDSDDQASTVHAKINEKTEMEEQCVIVAEVASQLAQYARKAMGTRRGKASRRSGIVTPPFSSSSRPFKHSSGNLLTYDDEYINDADRFEQDESNRGSVVCDTSDVVALPTIRVAHDVIPFHVAEGIVERLLNSIVQHERGPILTGAKVALFCMIASPSTEKNFCSEMQHMLSSCGQLSADFKQYRMALHPSELNDELNCFAFQQSFEHEGSRCAFVHEFMIFAINSMQMLLVKVYASYANEDDVTTLEDTLKVWQKSVGVTA